MNNGLIMVKNGIVHGIPHSGMASLKGIFVFNDDDGVDDNYSYFWTKPD